MNRWQAETAMGTYQLRGFLSSVVFCVCNLFLIIYICITLLWMLEDFVFVSLFATRRPFLTIVDSNFERTGSRKRYIFGDSTPKWPCSKLAEIHWHPPHPSAPSTGIKEGCAATQTRKVCFKFFKSFKTYNTKVYKV